MARRRSWFAWYVASPFVVIGLVRLAFFLVDQMDTKRDFPVRINRHSGPSDQDLARIFDASPDAVRREMDKSSAQHLASSALLDLAHEASAAGDVDVAKRAYEADAAIIRQDARAVRDAMDKLAKADAGRASSYASSRDHAERRVNDWLAAD